MRKYVLWLSLIAFLFSPAYAVLQSESGVELSSPQPGAVLQGAVPVIGKVDPPGLRSWELLFAYADNYQDGSSFILTQGDRAVQDDSLIVWDTTLIPDGNYRLILRVFLADGREEDFVVDNLRVRNYSPVETATPPVVERIPTPTESITLQPSPTAILATATAYQPNPGSVRREQVVESALRGIGLAALSLLLLGIYLSVRRRGRRS
jgi:hypothetical protein